MCGGCVRRGVGEKHTNSCHRFLPPQSPHPPRSPPERDPHPLSMPSSRPYFFSYYLVYTSIRPHVFFHSTRMACWRRHLFAIALTHASHPHTVRHAADESCAEFAFAGPLAFPPPYTRRNPATPPCPLVCLWAASARRGSERLHAQLREQVHGLCGEFFSPASALAHFPVPGRSSLWTASC
jgi:hypothetical protein